MRKGMMAASLALCALAAVPATAKPGGRSAAASLTERNRAVVTKFADLFYKQRKVREAFMTYVAPGYIQHNPIATDGRDAAIAALVPYIEKSPDAKFEVQRILVDGNLAAVHAKSMRNPQDRGSAVVDLFRLENGKIVEHWDVIQPVPEKSANAHPMF